ncbi:hypothetical protein JCM21900_004656 [Sporobolomyces salmonicolor]
MFFNSDLLTKRGALAQVWMASHLSTKLSKQALTSTSIPKSVQSILGQDLLPMALRLSGQLLLGIARIYSRKTKYLLDDAQETLGKVKKAFQNEGRAAVDLPEDHHAHASVGAEDGARGGREINLRREGGDLEDMLALEFADGEWSLEKHLAANASKDKGKGKAKALTANVADITLDESLMHQGYFDYVTGVGGLDDSNGFDTGDFDLGLGLGFDPDFALFEGDDELNAIARPSGHQQRPKKRIREDGEEVDDDQSIELGRDAAAHASSERGSIGPFDLDFRAKDAEGDLNMLDGEGGEQDLGGFDAGQFDLGLNFDDGFVQNEFGGGGVDEEQLPTFGTPSRAGSVAAATVDESLQLTPRAAAQVVARQAADGKQPAKKRQKALAVDKVIELDWQAGRLTAKERFKDPEFLPRSRLHLALLAPNAHASLLPQSLPKPSKTSPSLELFGPPGLLAPELQDLFKFPTRRERIRLEGRERQKDGERDVELGRRAISVLSNLVDDFGADHLNRDFGGGGDEGDLTFGLGNEGEDMGGFDQGDFQFDLGGLDGEPPVTGDEVDPNKTPTKRSKKQKMSHAGAGDVDVTPARSIFSTTTGRALLEDDERVYRSEGPLAVFDELTSSRAAPSPSQTQSQVAASHSLATEEEDALAQAETQTQTQAQKSGSVSLQNRNTRKAVRVIKEQLELEEQEVGEKKVEFNKVAEKASRRAASSFFFELLVLSSADVVKLKQQDAYGNIEVRVTDKLREIAV